MGLLEKEEGEDHVRVDLLRRWICDVCMMGEWKGKGGVED